MFAFRLAAVAALTLIAAAPALACSCKPMSREQMMAQVPFVFEGKVLRAYSEGGETFTEFEVVRPLKGAVPTRVEVASRRSPAACGVSFTPGERLTVGATFKEHQFHTNSCIIFSLNKPKR